MKLNNSKQKELISTFAQFTNEKDPYEKINFLEIENQILKKEIQLLKQEKQIILKQFNKTPELE